MAYHLFPCPVCGASEAALVADGEAIRGEVEALWAFHLRRLREGAPIEELYDRTVFSQRPPLEIVRCTTCGTLRRNPAEAPAEVVRAYAAEAVDGDVLDALREVQRPFFEGAEARLHRALGRRGEVLEVGSYAGGFLDVARERGWRVRGIDVSESATGHARRRGHDVRALELAELAAAEPRGALDAVAIWSCFEQLPAPRSAVADAARLLRPGGVLVLRVPNGAFYRDLRGGRGARGAAARALLALNNLLGFPYRYGYTAASLGRLVGSARLAPIGLRGDALVPTSGPWTRRWAAVEAGLVRSALRLAAPARLSPWLELYARRPAAEARG